MAIYSIISDGLLHVKHKTVAFRSAEGEVRYLPLKTTTGIIVSGNVKVTSGYLTSMKIPVTVFVRAGRPASILLPARRRTVNVIKASRLFLNHRLEVARAIELTAAQHFSEKLTGLPTDQLSREAATAFRTAASLDELRGIEGSLYREFYSIMDLFLPEYLAIGRREYYPPPNPGNALVSFINSMIYSYLLIWLVSAGLPTEISFIHEPRGGTLSLALDVAEIFRPFLLPKTVFLATRKYHLVKRDFERRGTAVYLTRSGKRKVSRAFLEETQRYVRLGRRRMKVDTYAKLVASRLKASFEGEYIPSIPSLSGWH